MEVINDFERTGEPGRMEYVLDDGNGSVRVVHNHLGCGITLNCVICRSECFSNRDMIGDIDMLGVSMNLVGVTECRAETFEVTLVPGNLFITQPSAEKQSVRIVGGACDNVAIGYIAGSLDLEHIEGDPDMRTMLEEIRSRYGNAPLLQIAPPVHAQVILRRLYDEGLSDTRDDAAIRRLASELLHVLYGCPSFRFIPGCIGDPEKDMADEALATLSSDRNGYPPVQQVAASLGIDVFRLNRIFRKRYGTTPYALQRHHRMVHAAYLLNYSDLPVGEVAARVGYRSPSKFSDAFRQEVGCRPRDFRRLHRTMVGGSSPAGP